MLLLALVATPPARAAGTLAGTAISNQAYGDYNDANGNPKSRVYSNTVTTTVSQVAGVSIVPPTVTSAATNGQVINYLVQLFNTGNGTDTQTFTYATSSDWTPTLVRMFYDLNNDHVYNAGDVLLTETAPGSKTYKTVNGAGTPVLINPDDHYVVIMEVTVPAVGVAPNGTSSVVTITTMSDFDNTKTATGTYTTTVLAAVVAAVKTHTPAGNPTYLQPGDLVTYTTTVTNSGSATAVDFNFTDIVPAQLTYVPGTLKFNFPGVGWVDMTDAADGDGAKYDAASKSIMAPDNGFSLDLPAGQTGAFQFQATVNAGVPSGTAVTNQATFSYTSGTSLINVQSNGDTILIATLSMIDLNTTTGPKTGDPGDQIVYPFNAVNNSNSPDKIELTAASTAAWAWLLWADMNGDGIPGNDGDYLLTDTDGDGKVDTGALAQSASLTLLAVTTIPPGSANGALDQLTISGASATTPAVTDSLIFTTTVRAPVLSIVKALTTVQAPSSGPTCTPTNPNTGAPCQVFPGSVLTYTMTASNSGNGNMTSLVLIDHIPTNTTYLPGSILSGSSSASLSARTDAMDGDGAEFNTGSNAVIVPDGTNLIIGSGGTWAFRFQVTVN
jgi:uncharacterized repeat protein (TIGR01451 family)